MLESNGYFFVVVFYFVVFEDGELYLFGSCCVLCGVIYFGECIVCLSCMVCDQMKWIEFLNEGEFYVYLIVYCFFFGILIFYVFVIVDFDGGGIVKGNFVGVDFDLSKIEMGMCVKVVYEKVLI